MDAIEKSKTADQLREIIRTKRTGNIEYDKGIREKAAIRVASPDVEVHIRHMLEPFSALLDPNPREMKRLINGYGLALAIDMILGKSTDPKILAFWTIMNFRWPRLAARIGYTSR